MRERDFTFALIGKDCVFGVGLCFKPAGMLLLAAANNSHGFPKREPLYVSLDVVSNFPR